MVKITVEIEGMSCSMCEAHINDTLRKAFPLKRVSSSHLKNQAVILSEEAIGEKLLREAMEPTGYRVTSVRYEPYEKKHLFRFGK